MLKLDYVTQINGKPDWIELSADGRWLALRYGDEWRLFDATTGHENGRIRHPDTVPSLWAAIAPDGTALATQREGVIMVAHTSGKQVTRAYNHLNSDCFGNDVCFTANSQGLWAAMCDDKNVGKMALLDAATLDEIAAVPVPVAREDDHRHWAEPHSILHIPSDTLALHHGAGDHLLGVFFFKYHENQIRQYPLFVSPDSDDLRQMNGISFSVSGQFFAGIDGPFLWVWRLEDMQLIGRGFKNVLKNIFDLADDEEDEEFAGLTFIGEQMVAGISSESKDELCVVNVANEKVLSLHRLPPNVSFPSSPCITPMRGQTLVGMKGDDVVIYRLSLKEDCRTQMDVPLKY